MRARRRGKRLKVIAALKDGDDAALTGIGGYLRDLVGDPGKIILDQLEPTDRIGPMGIETGGNHNNIRGKVTQRR